MDLNMGLIDAILQEDIEAIKELLAQGADPNYCQDKAYITPMHFVAQQNILEAVPLLVAAGADLDPRTQAEGESPLQIAQLHGHTQMVTLLAAYMSKANALTNQH